MPTLHRRRAIRSFVIAVTASLIFDGAGAVAQEEQRKRVLRKDHGNIAGLDLFWGSGSAERAPSGPFVFLKHDATGTQPKIEVRDSAGREWNVKFGEEVHSEIAANRLVWAFGYMAEELYYVPTGSVTGVTRPGSTRNHIDPGGTFSKARFHLKDGPGEKADGRWTFEKNPFVGTKELSGLAILMTMVNNWDILGDRNNRILRLDGEERYIVSDVGATFGKMGAFPVPRTKWNIEDFKKEEFIENVKDGMVDLDYEGYGKINKVPLEHARWFAGLASQLTDEQLQAAFRASGANDVEVTAFSSRLREKITELAGAVAQQKTSR